MGLRRLRLPKFLDLASRQANEARARSVTDRLDDLIRLFFVATAAVAVLCACSKQATQPGQLVVGLDAELERLDPLTMKNPKSFIVSWQIYQGLLGLDDAGNIVPEIADHWETKDNVSWQFHIRPGVNFQASDLFGPSARARPVTAEDVVASYTAFCSPAAYPAFLLTDSIKGCADYNAGKATVVDGIRAIDGTTVEVTLLKPEPFFLNRLTTPWIAIFPREALEPKYKDTWGLTFAVGTGPYQLVSRNDNEVVLKRNPDYWDQGQTPAVEKLVFRIIKNDQVRLAELEKGGIDMMLVPPQLFPVVLDSSGSLKSQYGTKFSVQTFKTYNSHMIGMNVNLIPDLHLRRAMYYGVNRQQIVQTLLYGKADVTGGTVPPGMNGYVPPFDPSKLYDPRLAHEELAKSSYKGQPIEMLVHEQADSAQIGQLFQSEMKDLGINVQLTKLDFNSVIGRMVKGDAPMFSMFLDYVFSSPEPVLLNMFSSSKRPVPNFWQFSDPTIDSELDELRQLQSAAAIKKSEEIERQIMDQAPTIFLFRLNGVVLHSTRWRDIPINPHGYFDFAVLKTSDTG
jgi:ABC-type transport system substrate-binding protein